MAVTLIMNSKQIPMNYEWLNSQITNNWKQVGTGDVQVTGGEWAGTYNNVPVYQYNGQYFVWPNYSFSAASSKSSSNTTPGSTTTTTPSLTSTLGNRTTLVVLGGALVAVGVIVGLIHYHDKSKKSAKYYGW
jgi:hypothetical protein